MTLLSQRSAQTFSPFTSYPVWNHPSLWKALAAAMLLVLAPGCEKAPSAREGTAFEVPDAEMETPTLQWFQTDVFSGNASVSVPIPLPSGPGGFAPSLGLSYSSFRGAQENDEDSGDIAGRGWALNGLSYIERNVLVIGGVSHPIRGQRLEDDTQTQLHFIDCPGTQRLHERAVVRTADGTLYEFGGITCAHKPTAALLDPALCTGAACDQARDMFRAVNQWTKWQYRGSNLEPGRLMLRAMTDRFGNRIEFFYELEAVRASANSGRLAVRHVRPRRIVWGKNAATHAAWGALADKILNGTVSVAAIGQEIHTLETTLAQTPHLEAVFDYGPRRDGRHRHPGNRPAGQGWSSAFQLEAVEGRVIAAGGTAPQRTHRTVLTHDLLSDGMAYLTAIAQGVDGLNPPMRFDYTPDDGERAHGYRNTLLRTVHNGTGGSIAFTYAGPNRGTLYDYIHGVVWEKTVHDGQQHWAKETYRRDTSISRSQRQGKEGYAGSRMVLVQTTRSCDGGPSCPNSVLESCTEHRFFTNLETFPSGQRYDFADGETSVDTPYEREDHRWLEALAGRPYQTVAWQPVNGGCPTPGEGQWRAYKATEWSKALSTDERRYRVTFLGEHDTPRVEVVETRAKTFSVQRTNGLQGPFQQIRTTTTYDAFSNPLTVAEYRDRRGAPAPAPAVQVTMTYHNPVEEGGMTVLTGRVATTLTQAQVPGHQGLQEVAKTVVETYHTAHGRPTAAPARQTEAQSPSQTTVTETVYDAHGNVTAVVVSDGQEGGARISTHTVWDSTHATWPIEIIQGAGTDIPQRHLARYDAKQRLAETIGPFRAHETLEKTTRIAYDDRSRVTTVTRFPGGADHPLVTSHAYHDAQDGQLPWIQTCTTGRCSTRHVNGWGQVIAATGPDGTQVTTTYDGLGRAVAVSAPHAHDVASPPLTTTTYDVATASVVTDSASGVRTQVCPGAYGAVGLTETRVGAPTANVLPCTQDDAVTRGLRRRRVQTDFGQIARSTAMPFNAAEGFTTAFDRDGLGRAWTITDPKGRAHTRHYVYGLLTVSADPDRGTTQMTYDGLGRLRSLSTPESRAKGGAIVTTYDSLGRITQITRPDSTTQTHYDRGPDGSTPEHSVGLIVGQTETYPDGRVFSVRHDYDAGQRLRATTQSHGDDTAWTVRYGYNPATGEQVCSHVERGPTQSIWRYFDPQTGQLTGLALADAPCTDRGTPPSPHQLLAQDYAYTNGRLESVRYFDQSRDSWSFTPSGRLFQIGHTITVAGRTVPANLFGYRYTPFGDIHTIDETVHGDHQTFTYDGLSRLTQAVDQRGSTSGQSTRRYRYDPLGNFLSYVSDHHTYTYDTRGRLAAGTARTGQPFELTYGIADSGRVTRRRFGAAGSHPAHTTTFRYDAAGRLLEQRTAHPDDPFDLPALVGHVYGPEGLRLIIHTFEDDAHMIRFGPGGYEEEHALPNGAVTRRLKLASGLSTITLQGTATGKLVPQRVLHKDHLGSTRWASATDPQRVFQAHYTPFGYSLDGNAHKTQEGFTGQRSREYGKLINYKDRQYDPLIGRFMSPDKHIPNPLNGQDYNAFAYVANNPIAFVDPDGKTRRSWRQFFNDVWTSLTTISEETERALTLSDGEPVLLNGPLMALMPNPGSDIAVGMIQTGPMRGGPNMFRYGAAKAGSGGFGRWFGGNNAPPIGSQAAANTPWKFRNPQAFRIHNLNKIKDAVQTTTQGIREQVSTRRQWSKAINNTAADALRTGQSLRAELRHLKNVETITPEQIHYMHTKARHLGQHLGVVDDLVGANPHNLKLNATTAEELALYNKTLGGMFEEIHVLSKKVPLR